MSATKKGQCPVKFLWHGDGFAKTLMTSGLSLLLLGFLMSLFFIMIGKNLLIARSMIAVAVVVWTLGKLMHIVKKMVPRRGLEPPRRNLH